MQTVEVDFDVFKQLTMRRTTEYVSYNDVLRELLGLGQGSASPSSESAKSSPEDWVAKGVRFPVGTDFRANYKGKVHVARSDGGSLSLNGKQYDSPSAAAMAVTSSPVNGWRFWECRLPGKSSWQLIESLRR